MATRAMDLTCWAWGLVTPEDLDLTCWAWPAAETITVTLDCTASTSADINHYHIYRSGLDGKIDLASIHAETDSFPWSEDITGGTGRRAYLVRAVDDDDNEEANLSQIVWVDIVAGAVSTAPNEPGLVSAVAVADGEAEVAAIYDRTGEAGEATTIYLYANDGGGGTVDWGTSIGSATLGTGRTVQMVEITSSGLTGGKTYLVGVRAETAAGVQDQNTETASVTTDAAAPDAPVVTGTVV